MKITQRTVQRPGPEVLHPDIKGIEPAVFVEFGNQF
jgi:hypothetical protein